MKHPGSKYEWERERNADLLRAYREAISRVDFVDLATICERVVKMPSRQFWISPKRAATIVAQIEAGNAPKLRDNGQRRINEIYSRYKKVRETNHTDSIYTIVSKIVFQPAPEFYLTPASANVIIHRIKRENYNKCRQRLRHIF